MGGFIDSTHHPLGAPRIWFLVHEIPSCWSFRFGSSHSQSHGSGDPQ